MTLASSSRPRSAIGIACRWASAWLLSGTPAKQPTALPPGSKDVRPTMMPADLTERLRVLNTHGVEFLVVGGYAFGASTEPRATEDLDIFVRSDEENSEASTAHSPTSARRCTTFHRPISGTAAVSTLAVLPCESISSGRSTDLPSTKPGRAGWKHTSRGKSGLQSFPLST